MIINIRGVEGSGKTTAAKILYQQWCKRKVVFNRKNKPIITLCYGHPTLHDTAFLGPYADTDPYTIDKKIKSGADSIENINKLKACIYFCVDNNIDVVYENTKFQSVKLLTELSQLDDVSVFALTTSQEQIENQISHRSRLRSDRKATKSMTNKSVVDKSNKELEKFCRVIHCDNTSVAEHIHDISVKRERSDIDDYTIQKLAVEYDLALSHKQEKTKLNNMFLYEGE